MHDLHDSAPQQRQREVLEQSGRRPALEPSTRDHRLASVDPAALVDRPYFHLRDLLTRVVPQASTRDLPRALTFRRWRLSRKVNSSHSNHHRRRKSPWRRSDSRDRRVVVVAVGVAVVDAEVVEGEA